MPKREQVGAIFTDVASVMVGDPCKMLKDRRDESPPLEYGDFCEAWEAQGTPADDDRFRGGTPAEVVKFGRDGSGSLAIRTVGNCDGWCRVYVERDREGNAKRLIIDLDAKASPYPSAEGAGAGAAAGEGGGA